MKGLAHSLKYSVQMKSGKNNSVAFSFHCLNTTQEVYTQEVYFYIVL